MAAVHETPCELLTNLLKSYVRVAQRIARSTVRYWALLGATVRRLHDDCALLHR